MARFTALAVFLLLLPLVLPLMLSNVDCHVILGVQPFEAQPSNAVQKDHIRVQRVKHGTEVAPSSAHSAGDSALPLRAFASFDSAAPAAQDPARRAAEATLPRDVAAPAPARDAAAPVPARDAAAPVPARGAAAPAPARNATPPAPARDAAAVEAYRSRCWKRGFSPTNGRSISHTPEPYISAPTCRGRLFLIAIVHSAVGNRGKRDLIRRTWASVQNIGGRRMATVFVIGRSDVAHENRRVDAESAEFGDMVVANFRDCYRNLTYKNLYGIRWAVEHCPKVSFVLKTDDDALVNPFHLVDYISDRLSNAKNFFYCKTAKETRNSAAHYKWYVSPKEWPAQEYPVHCKGLGYLFSADLLPAIHLCAKWRSYFWIDDIFVTGAVAHEALGATLLHWSPGWDYRYMHPRIVGPKVAQAVIFNEYDSQPVPSLTLRIWQAMLHYSA